jgi:hypothetical protein
MVFPETSNVVCPVDKPTLEILALPYAKLFKLLLAVKSSALKFVRSLIVIEAILFPLNSSVVAITFRFNG